ncbi:polysaccharide deacetylase family protein [Halostagnicola bangensis]
MSRRRATRRRILTLSGTAAAAGLAGCSERIDDVTNGSDDSNGESSDEQTASALSEGVPPLETEYNSREEYADPGESFDDFEDVEPWEVIEGEGEADEDHAFAGDQSLKLNSDGEDNILVERDVDDEDFTDRDLSFAVRTTTPGNITINVHLVDRFGDEKIYSLREITYREPDVGWFRSSPGVFEETEIEPDLGQLDRIELHVLHSMDEAEVWIDDIRTHDTPDQGYVILCWDDGSTDYYETASPLHDEYDFSTVQAPVPRWTEEGRDGIMSVSQLQERQDEGDQIVVHGTHSPLHEVEDEDDLEARLGGDKNWFIEHGFEGANYIVYPHNSFDQTSLEYITDYHYCGGFNQAGNVNTTGVYGFDPLALPRTIGHDLDIATRCIDLVEEHNQCSILNFHTFEADNTMDEDDYEELLEYIDDSDVEVITFDELWEMRTSVHFDN